MPRYRVYGSVVGGKYLGEVEADSKREAEEKALDLPEAYVSLCHQCVTECENAEIDSVVAEEITADE